MRKIVFNKSNIVSNSVKVEDINMSLIMKDAQKKLEQATPVTLKVVLIPLTEWVKTVNRKVAFSGVKVLTTDGTKFFAKLYVQLDDGTFLKERKGSSLEEYSIEYLESKEILENCEAALIEELTGVKYPDQKDYVTPISPDNVWIKIIYTRNQREPLFRVILGDYSNDPRILKGEEEKKEEEKPTSTPKRSIRTKRS